VRRRRLTALTGGSRTANDRAFPDEAHMKLKLLGNAEMHAVTVRALAEHRASLEDEAAFAPVLAELEELLPDLESVLSSTDASAEALAAEGGRLDAEHDRLLRHLFGLLDALAELSEPDMGERLRTVRTRLFPDGLPMLNRPYAEHAREAERAATRLDDADRALLQAIALPGGGSIHDAVLTWMRACEALGAFERRRTDAEESARTLVFRQVVVRNRWIRAIEALQTQVRLRGLDWHPVLCDIDDAVERITARGKARA
jgi:hypothetical protein